MSIADPNFRLLRHGSLNANEAIAVGLVVGRLTANDTTSDLVILDGADQLTNSLAIPSGISYSAAAAANDSLDVVYSGEAWAVAGGTGVAAGDLVVAEASTGEVIATDQITLYTGSWVLGRCLVGAAAGDRCLIDVAPYRSAAEWYQFFTVNLAAGVDRGQVVKLVGGSILAIDEANQAAAQQILPFAIVLEDTADTLSAPCALQGIVPLEAGANALVAGEYWCAEDGGDIIGEADVTLINDDWVGGRITTAAAIGALGVGTFEPNIS